MWQKLKINDILTFNYVGSWFENMYISNISHETVPVPLTMITKSALFLLSNHKVFIQFMNKLVIVRFILIFNFHPEIKLSYYEVQPLSLSTSNPHCTLIISACKTFTNEFVRGECPVRLIIIIKGVDTTNKKSHQNSFRSKRMIHKMAS